MNLYFRLLFLLISFWFIKKDTHPLGKTTLKMRVWPNDLDLNWHLNNGRYLTMMDLGRFDLLAKTNLLQIAKKHQWMPVLGGAKVTFFRSLNLWNRFSLTTQVLYWDEKWVYLEQKFVSKGKVMATALLKALFLSKDGKVLPEELLSHVKEPITRPAPPTHLLKWIEAERE